MTFPFELKAIGYGLAVFIGGYLVMSVLGSGVVTLGQFTSGKPGWLLVTVIGYLVPVSAGFVAAFFATVKRIIHGTVGGSIGIFLMLLPAIFAPDYSISEAMFVIATYVVLASLGAIVGSHLRAKNGH